MLEVLPRSDTDASLSLDGMIALWQRLLGHSPIGADDDFFELGGDSLQALTLFHEIERVTGRTLPITAIYDAATPARLVALLNDDAPTRFSPLVPLKTGVGEPLYIVHGIGGNVIELVKLGQLMDTSRPIYAIQARGVDGSDEPYSRVIDMVDYYVAHLRAHQPHGPYLLAGYSFGGIVAMDIARRLQAWGERVPFLAFIDSYAHPHTFPKMARQFVRAGVVLADFRTKPFRQACLGLLARVKGRGVSASAPTPIMADFVEDGTSQTLRKVHAAAYEALNTYRPWPYLGHVEFFRPRVSIFSVAPWRVWGKLVDSMTVHHVPGDHSGMVRAHVIELAAAMSRALRAASDR